MRKLASRPETAALLAAAVALPGSSALFAWSGPVEAILPGDFELGSTCGWCETTFSPQHPDFDFLQRSFESYSNGVTFTLTHP